MKDDTIKSMAEGLHTDTPFGVATPDGPQLGATALPKRTRKVKAKAPDGERAVKEVRAELDACALTIARERARHEKLLGELCRAERRAIGIREE